jgi:RNA polymerase sigma-70 factor, ECF subfamily
MDDNENRFRALFRSAYPALQRYARHRGLAGADADDLVAATLEVAWRRLDDVPADDCLPWLYAVARNLWRSQRRRDRRRAALLARLDLADRAVDPPEQPELEAGALRRALSQLEQDDQEILRLVAWDGLSPAQAAIVLGCSPGAARTRLHRARDRLAVHLGFDLRPPRSRPAAQNAGGQRSFRPASRQRRLTK